MPQDRAPTVNGLTGVGQIKFADSTFEDVLARVAELAKQSLPGVADASVNVLLRRGAHAVAFTGSLALDLDTYEYECGHGPGLTAAATGTTVVTSDLLIETRWPKWTAKARTAGVRSSLSIGFPTNETLSGAMNLYSRATHAFDDSVVRSANSFVESTLATITNAQEYAASVELAQNLRAALESRAVIEQAKGIIMSERHCGPDEAFAILATLSQHSNRRLRDVAAALVATAVQGQDVVQDHNVVQGRNVVLEGADHAAPQPRQHGGEHPGHAAL